MKRLLVCLLGLLPLAVHAATLTMEWDTTPLDLAGEPLAWNHSLWFVWTSPTNHTRTNTVAQGWIPSVTAAPTSNTLTRAVWTNAVLGVPYWVRVATVAVDGGESAWSDPVRATADPEKPSVLRVRITR